MTLNILFSVVGIYEPYPIIFLLHLREFVLIPIRIYWTTNFRGNSSLANPNRGNSHFPHDYRSLCEYWIHSQSEHFVLVIWWCRPPDYFHYWERLPNFACVVQFLLNMCLFWYPSLKPHLTIYCSNIGVCLRLLTKSCTSTLHAIRLLHTNISTFHIILNIFTNKVIQFNIYLSLRLLCMDENKVTSCCVIVLTQVRLAMKNGDQKDTCQDGIGLCAHNLGNI